MLTKNFFQAISEERSIFRNFNSHKTIGNFEVFCSPDLNEIPHWNLAYPTNLTFPFPSFKEIVEIEHFYAKQHLEGHMAVFIDKYQENAGEESEYFVLNSNPKLIDDSGVNVLTHTASNLDKFCELISVSFALAPETLSYFKSKMSILQKTVNSKFFVISRENQVIGGCSIFETSNNSSFMFNVATHPDFQRQGIASDIIAYSAMNCSNPLYIYSHNLQMRKSILPNLGFESLGTLWCVPIKTFSKSINEQEI